MSEPHAGEAPADGPTSTSETPAGGISKVPLKRYRRAELDEDKSSLFTAEDDEDDES